MATFGRRVAGSGELYVSVIANADSRDARSVLTPWLVCRDSSGIHGFVDVHEA